MDPSAKLAALLELAESLGIEVRSAPTAGDSALHGGGALVRLKGREILFLDPAAAVCDQIAAAAAALRGRSEIEGKFLPPAIRELLDETPAGE